MNTTILFSYPLLALFRRIRRVDSLYAYLVMRDGFVPLRRREGYLSAIWKYDKYQIREKLTLRTRYGDKEYAGDLADMVLSSSDEICQFFQTKLEEEYESSCERLVELYKKWNDEDFDNLWIAEFNEKYGEKHIYAKTQKKYNEDFNNRCPV